MQKQEIDFEQMFGTKSMNQETSKTLKVMAKTEKEKESVQPTVINDTLVKQYMVEYNKENKIFDHNEDPLWTLSHLQLSYKNIIGIDNLDCMSKLTKLQLDNNIICKIENLETMVNLTWLDMSFNLIDKIEGLENLLKLSDLSFYSNKIHRVENIDHLKHLNVFSFGKNLVSDMEGTVKYIRKLNNSNLQVINMEDNPYNYQGQAERDYKLFAICLLPHLNYLDYNYITEEQRKKAETKIGEQVAEIDREGANEQKKGVVEREPDEILVKAHIASTEEMFKKILAASEANREFEVLHVEDIWTVLEEKLDEPTQKFQGQMKALYLTRVNDIAFCERELKKAAKIAEEDCVKVIREFTSYRKK